MNGGALLDSSFDLSEAAEVPLREKKSSCSRHKKAAEPKELEKKEIVQIVVFLVFVPQSVMKENVSYLYSNSYKIKIDKNLVESGV